MALPTVPCSSLAPTTAMTFGSSMAFIVPTVSSPCDVSVRISSNSSTETGKVNPAPVSPSDVVLQEAAREAPERFFPFAPKAAIDALRAGVRGEATGGSPPGVRACPSVLPARGSARGVGNMAREWYRWRSKELNWRTKRRGSGEKAGASDPKSEAPGMCDDRGYVTAMPKALGSQRATSGKAMKITAATQRAARNTQMPEKTSLSGILDMPDTT